MNTPMIHDCSKIDLELCLRWCELRHVWLLSPLFHIFTWLCLYYCWIRWKTSL